MLLSSPATPLIEIDRSIEPSAEPTSDSCPGLTIAVLTDQAVAFGCVVQLVLYLVLLESTAATQRPSVQAA